MKRSVVLIALALLAFSCSEPEAREPVTSKSGTFFKESVKRNKMILAREEAAIKQIIDKDSLGKYYPSEEGFWFKYIVKDTSGIGPAVEDDLVALTYNIQTLNGNIIYSENITDTITYKVDKQEIIFPGLRKAVKLLKKGEKAVFYFPSSLAYGYLGDHKKIGVNVPLKSKLEILDIQQKQDSIPN